MSESKKQSRADREEAFVDASEPDGREAPKGEVGEAAEHVK